MDNRPTCSKLAVIPAKAGIHASHSPWIPAFAGMTSLQFQDHGQRADLLRSLSRKRGNLCPWDA